MKRTIIITRLTALLLAPLSALQAAGTPKANLLLIMTDQQRWDAMSCAGNKVVKTPNLDQLARTGARFTSFYSACPVCVPARTAILTGHDIEANHVLGNEDARLENQPSPRGRVRRGPAGALGGGIHAATVGIWRVHGRLFS